MKYKQVFIGLGSNLGNRMQYLQSAIGLFREYPQCRLVQQSPIYETEPRYVSSNPSYLNQIIQIETDLEPEELLALCQKIERKIGRQSERERYAPRPIDADLLSVCNETRSATHLELPHPAIFERKFVLQPWADISPEYVIPRWNCSVRTMLGDCEDPTHIHQIQRG